MYVYAYTHVPTNIYRYMYTLVKLGKICSKNKCMTFFLTIKKTKKTKKQGYS